MIDPVLTQVFVTTLTYGLCGSLAAVIVWLVNRQKAGPRFDQAAAVGFVVGAAFGAFIGIFQSLLAR
jgi:hypothetical protein